MKCENKIKLSWMIAVNNEFHRRKETIKHNNNNSIKKEFELLVINERGLLTSYPCCSSRKGIVVLLAG